MTKNEIIGAIADSGIVESLIAGMRASRDEDTDNLKDLAQEIYMDLLLKPEDKIQHLWETGEWKFFIAKMLSNNLNSSTSRYDKIYRREKRFEEIEI